MGRASEQHCQHFRAFTKLGLGLPQIEEYQGYNNREMGNFSTGQYHHGWLTSHRMGHPYFTEGRGSWR